MTPNIAAKMPSIIAETLDLRLFANHAATALDNRRRRRQKHKLDFMKTVEVPLVVKHVRSFPPSSKAPDTISDCL